MTTYAPPPAPIADPLPWVTQRMTRAGAFAEANDETYDYRTNSHITRRKASGHAVAALLDVLTQTVSALHDDGRAYRVVLNAASASAGTLLERRIVEVGSKPWADKDLTQGQKAAVMCGLALHEVGHIRFARQYTGAVSRLFGKEHVTGAILTLSNLAADCHDEAAAMRAFPGLAPAIPVVLWWVGGKGQQPSVTASAMLTQSIRDRVNLTIAAARYPWQVSWDTDAARDWLDWWQEWASRAAEAGEPKEHALIVKEAIEKVRAFEPDLPDDEPEPEREHEPGERAFGQGESSPTQSRDMSDTEPQPGEPSGASQDDAEGPGEPEGSNDPTDPEGGPEGGPDEPPGDDSDPKGEDADPDGWAVEDDSDPEPEPEPEPGQGGEGGEDDSQASATGSHGDSNPSQPEPWEEGRLSQEDYDSACVKDASRDFDDAVLQSKAEKVTRGTREGMRKRHYRHPSSVYGQSNYGGRNVVSIPRKGKRWVYDI